MMFVILMIMNENQFLQAHDTFVISWIVQTFSSYLFRLVRTIKCLRACYWTELIEVAATKNTTSLTSL
uniref:Uncharacterized protein n=1 Tax=Kalanchoe fedtschenkoi TaxID=63787 RepID=A0A7N1A2B1_KALFE